MISIAIHNVKGEKVGTHDMSDAVFGTRAKESVVHQVVTALRANLRSSIAHTKTKGEVRGGGRKPWRQKGTGRARVGSNRSPIWRGGGITFGPRSDRNFSQKVNDKVKKLSLRAVLSDKVKNEKLVVVDSLLDMKKTKEGVLLLKNIQVKGSVLIVSALRDTQVMNVFNNIPHIHVVPVTSLNTLDAVKYTTMVIDIEGLKKLDIWLAPKK